MVTVPLCDEIGIGIAVRFRSVSVDVAFVPVGHFTLIGSSTPLLGPSIPTMPRPETWRFNRDL